MVPAADWVRRVALMRGGWEWMVASWRRAVARDPAAVVGALSVSAAALSIGCGLALVKLTETVWRGEDEVTLDWRVHEWVLGPRSPWATRAFRAVTLLGEPLAVALVVLSVGAVLLARRGARLASFPVVCSIGAAALVAVEKTLVGRPRPATADRLVSVSGAAFPSGHAAQSVACYGAVAVVAIWLTRSWWARAAIAAAAVVVAAAVGGSRVYLGVHWPSDVVAGWLLAAAWLSSMATVWLLWDHIVPRLHRQRRPATGTDPAPAQGAASG